MATLIRVDDLYINIERITHIHIDDVEGTYLTVDIVFGHAETLLTLEEDEARRFLARLEKGGWVREA